MNRRLNVDFVCAFFLREKRGLGFAQLMIEGASSTELRNVSQNHYHHCEGFLRT